MQPESNIARFERELGISAPPPSPSQKRFNAELYRLRTFCAADIARLTGKAERTARDMLVSLQRQRVIEPAGIEMRHGMGMQTRAVQVYRLTADFAKYEEEHHPDPQTTRAALKKEIVCEKF